VAAAFPKLPQCVAPTRRKEWTVQLTDARWPRPADPDRARLGLERWAEHATRTGDPDLERFARELADDDDGHAMLAAVFGNSPFLTEAMLREVGFVRDLVTDGVDAPFRRLIDGAVADLGGEDDRARLMAGLRRTRRRAALLIALADIAGLWDVDTVCEALSGLAETALRLAVRHLLRQAAARGHIDLPDPADPERGSGLIVLGMGKLGARELNYSSDIDLIVLYDDGGVATRQPDTLPRTFIRLTRDLVRIMEERTPDGYVFRTDLRLRPDPGATPIAVSVAGAESYYGSMAQTWERSAMIKARQVAGDPACGKAFQGFLRQFVWRRHLDFGAIAEIHAIKRQIHHHRGHDAIAVHGHDVKLGRGGIREIEFFVQTQQMIFGGRDPRLRVMKTCAGLRALAAAGRNDPAVADDLIEAYAFLRRVEHRLQMIGDQQVHVLPASEAGVNALGTFLGYDDPAAFRAALRETLETVEDHYARLFEEAPRLAGPADLVFGTVEDDPHTVETLARMGFANPPGVINTVRGWLHGRYRATRSERARRLLGEILPALLEAVAKTANPDTAWFRLDEFIGRLPTGVQPFSLFHSNPNIIGLIAEILGISPRLADHLARHTEQLDAVLTPGFFDLLPDAAALAEELDAQLGAAADFEDVLTVLRRWTHDKEFQAGVHLLHNAADGPDHGPFLSDVAETALRALQDRVEAEFARRHGRFPGQGLAILAMGKLGGREMSLRSDLDLIMVYDVAGDAAESDGPKPLAPTLYFTRLTQRLLSAMTAPTREGALYEVDMRLRPSGKAGPLATGLEAFVRYQHESAWTWEHMAVTRTRVISGPEALGARIRAAIGEVLTRPRDPEALLRDVADMRGRIDREHGTDNPWEVKYVRGGLVDVEFIAQYLQLRHAHDHPEVPCQTTAETLGRLAHAGLLDEGIAAELIEAVRLWQRVQAFLRLTLEGPFDPESAPAALKDGLARVILGRRDGDAVFAAAAERVTALQARVHGHFRTLVEAPAAALDGGG